MTVAFEPVGDAGAASSELVVSTGPRAQSSRIERMDQPRAGTYWRLREEITGKEDDQIYCDPLPVGTVLLLESVEYADGEAHAYTFAAHPAWPERRSSGSRFHADRFYRYWEYCPEGAQIRERELQELGREMAQTQALLLQPPPEATPVASLGYNPCEVEFSEGRALATSESVRDMSAYAERLRANAEATTAWITTHSATLQAQGKALARFHMERANVGMAQAKSQLDAVKGILRTVENLTLYTGEGVDVTQLRDGVPAPVEAPLTIYQDCLALDEELLLHLEQGGLDHGHLDSVAAVLADDELLARLIPADRGIVLCKFRSSYKEFVKPRDDADIVASMANAQLNRISQLHMILVRDGERIYLVDGPEFLQKIGQLMPSAAEQIGRYTDSRGEEIRREHLAYAKAQRDQLGALDAYAKVLIMLWGLRDRGDLFAEWQAPTFAPWLDWAFQDRYMRLVDQSTMLGVQRPSFGEYRNAQNRYFGKGACVAVRVSKIFTYDNIPGAFSRHSTRMHGGCWGHDRLYRQAGDAVLIDRVRADKRGPYVEVPLEYAGYVPHDETRRNITGKLYLNAEAMEEVLVLDRVHAADLSYYLSSRDQRRRYNEYVQLFHAARGWVSKRDTEEQPMRDALRTAVRDGALPHDPETLDEAITAALAIARTARRDQRAPAPGTSGFAAYRDGALDTLHTLLTSQGERVAAVDAWCAEHARLPLRLVSTGKGDFKLYLEPSPDEHDVRLGEAREASAVAAIFSAGGGLTVGQPSRELLRAVAGEHVIHDWQRTRELPGNPDAYYAAERAPRTVPAGAALWLQHQSLLDLRYEQAVALMDLPVRQSEAFAAGIDLDRLLRGAVGSKKRYVTRSSVRFAIGTALVRGKPWILFADRDALGHCYATGGDAMKRACEERITSRYGYPDAAMAALREGHGWTIACAPLAHVWPHRDALRCDALECSTAWEKDVFDPMATDGENAGRNVRCTSLTAVGADLFPWLARRTASAA